MNLQSKLDALRPSGQKKLAVLIDPDKVSLGRLEGFIDLCVQNAVGYIFVGGSLISHDQSKAIISVIKQACQIPTIIFPGSNLHIEPSAHGLLLLSLISGRNPEFLIGQHVVAAPLLKRTSLQILPTGYILVDSGVPTTVSYISNTTPIPANKPEVAACTAMAGEMLGLRNIYLDGGSGAMYPVSAEMISAVRQQVDVPLIVGGGINTPEKAQKAAFAGADVIVVGNALEKEPNLMAQIAQSLLEFA